VDFERLYAHRFSGIDQHDRAAVWVPIARFIHEQLGAPDRVLDPAAGRCEFVNAVPAAERWAVDRTAYRDAGSDPRTRFVEADVMEADLPAAYYDGIFVSNFLEHLASPEAVYAFLRRMHELSTADGHIAVMGPNVRYCAKEYWDCADHVLPLTHIAVEEHLVMAGFDLVRTYPKFLPYSFRGMLPPSPALTALYLRLRPVWRVLGKQFLVVGRRS
jgi:hypothetical protein